MTDNYAAVMNIECGILVFVNRTLDDCCQQGSSAIDRDKDVHLHYTSISEKKSLTLLVFI